MRHPLRSPLPAVALALAAAQLVACAAATALPSDVRVRLDARHRSRAVELRYSHFYGELYDDNRKLMLSPWAFADTSHIVDPKGRPIYPQRQIGTADSGTLPAQKTVSSELCCISLILTLCSPVSQPARAASSVFGCRPHATAA